MPMDSSPTASPPHSGSAADLSDSKELKRSGMRITFKVPAPCYGSSHMWLITLSTEAAAQGVLGCTVLHTCTEFPAYKMNRPAPGGICINGAAAYVECLAVVQDLTYSVKSHHDKKVTLNLLSSISGFFNSGEMSALVCLAS